MNIENTRSTILKNGNDAIKHMIRDLTKEDLSLLSKIKDNVLKRKTVNLTDYKTNPSMMFIKNKKSVKEVSTSAVTTNRNLKMSMVKNEYIINTYLDKCSTPEELKVALEQTSLISKNGDNEQVLKMILQKHKQGTKKKEHDFKNLNEEIAYIVDSKYNRALQIAPPQYDVTGKEIPKVKRKVNFTRTSMNNLQARHIYFEELGEFYSIKEKGNVQAKISSDIKFCYMEATDLIGYQKFKIYMDILSLWITSNIKFGKVTINIVIEPNRRSAIKDTINQWRRKRLAQFCTQDVELNVVEIDVTNKYLKGLNIAI